MTHFFPDPKPEKKIKEPSKGLKRTPIKKKPFIKDGSEITGTPDLIIILDGVMSEFVRLLNSNLYGLAQCFTCPNRAHWEEMQCGHFVPRKNLSTRHNLLNLKVQCVHCNEHLSGNLEIYATRLDEKYGNGTADGLKAMGRIIYKKPAFEYEELIEAYKKCVEKLKEDLINQTLS